MLPLCGELQSEAYEELRGRCLSRREYADLQAARERVAVGLVRTFAFCDLLYARQLASKIFYNLVTSERTLGNSYDHPNGIQYCEI